MTRALRVRPVWEMSLNEYRAADAWAYEETLLVQETWREANRLFPKAWDDRRMTPPAKDAAG